ncbi:sensor histidine kinase [Cellulomonas alba]|uniref:histidine kinase n=1 Tax=Cellulomonas alba TaxID=3053467 RepID=A0ABT7SBH2_9CELL|nr:HAMP domain-containing sensor histidine kinase [Cellulomonas alba]MDM7853533.1 HAMP domain-containing sensor histidine kinase [Cellulomonas alba]
MSDADDALVRQSVRRVAVAVAVAVAAVIVVVAAAAYLAGRAEGQERQARSVSQAERDRSADVASAAKLAGLGLLALAAAAGVGVFTARRAVAPLDDALRRQRRFVADASHELRTPLAIVHTRAQLVQARTPADDPRRVVVDQLVADTRVLGDVVTDLLVAAQLEAGRAPREDVDLLALAHATVASYEAVAPGVRLAVDGAPLVAEVAPTALRRALACLVDNAVAHSPEGATVRVDVRRAVRGAAEVVVTDEGPGFPADVEQLTERFRRADANQDGRPRFGLGLALVRDVAQAHGGRLELRPVEPGGGAAAIVLPAEVVRG